MAQADARERQKVEQAGDAGGERRRQEQRREAPYLGRRGRTQQHEHARRDAEQAQHHMHDRESRKRHPEDHDTSPTLKHPPTGFIA